MMMFVVIAVRVDQAAVLVDEGRIERRVGFVVSIHSVVTKVLTAVMMNLMTVGVDRKSSGHCRRCPSHLTRTPSQLKSNQKVKGQDECHGQNEEDKS